MIWRWINRSAGAFFILLVFLQNISLADDKTNFNEALELAKIGRFEDAADKFKALVNSANLEVSGLSMRAFGDCLARLSAYGQAMDSYTRFIEKFPNDKDTDKVRFLIGRCMLTEKNNKEKVKTLWQEIIRNSKDNELLPVVMHFYGLQLMKEKKYEEAIKVFREVVNKYPSKEYIIDKKTRYITSEVLAGQFAPNLIVSKKPAGIISQCSQYEIGRSYRLMAKYDLAIENYSTSINKFPNGPIDYISRLAVGNCYSYRAEDRNKAVLAFQELVMVAESKEFQNISRYQLSKLFLEEQEYDKACVELKSLLSESADYGFRVSGQFMLGTVYEKLNDNNKAMEEYEKIIKEYPEQEHWVRKAKEKLEIVKTNQKK